MNKRKRPAYRDVVAEKAPPVETKPKKPLKRDWQAHVRNRLKKDV